MSSLLRQSQGTAFTELEREEKKQQIKLMKHKSGKSTIVRKEVAQTLEQLRGRWRGEGEREESMARVGVVWIQRRSETVALALAWWQRVGRRFDCVNPVQLAPTAQTISVPRTWMIDYFLVRFYSLVYVNRVLYDLWLQESSSFSTSLT